MNATRERILQAAIDLADRDGFYTVNRCSTAREAGVSPALITFYFFHTDLLRSEVMQNAIDSGKLRVVAEGLAEKHHLALEAPYALRVAAAAELVAL